MTPENKPVPVQDHDSAAFWDACKRHELRAQCCSACGRFRWPPRGFCPSCYSWDYEWARLPGRGTVYSFSIVHHSGTPVFKDEVPYVVALVTLDGTEDQVRLLSNVVGCPPEQIQVGMPVEAVFEDRAPGVTVPVFRRLK